MKTLARLLISAAVLIGAAHAQAPGVPIYGPAGSSGGSFPFINSPAVVFATDADHTATYPESSGSSGVIKLTSAGTLTATRNLILPLVKGFQFTLINDTTGGQAIQPKGASGTFPGTIPNCTVSPSTCAMTVATDGINYVQIGSSSGGNTTSSSLTTNTIPKATGANSIGNSSIADNGAAVSTSENLSANNVFVNGGSVVTNEGTATGSTAGVDVLYGSSALHRLAMANNATGAVALVGTTAAGTSGDCVRFAANGFDVQDAGAPCGSGGGVTQFNGRTGAVVPTTNDYAIGQVSSPLAAVASTVDVSPYVIQANNIMDRNAQRFSDGTTYYSAGPAYASSGQYIDDQELTCTWNPNKCSTSLLLNVLTKWDSKRSALGFPLNVFQNLSSTPVYTSSFDAYEHYGTGDGRLMFPQVLYSYCKKMGLGSAECGTQYNAYIAHIKASFTGIPRDSSSSLFQVVPGDEWVCNTAFEEYMRNTGKVAQCNVWYAVDAADLAQIATALGNTSDAAYWTTENANVAAGIRANLIMSTGELMAATINNSTNDDVPATSLAVACDLLPDIYAPCNILTAAQKTTVENYFNDNYSSFVDSMGYIKMTTKSGGWTTTGVIPSGGGPPYGSTQTSGAGVPCATCYQGGDWSYHALWFATALAQVNPAQAQTMASTFLNAPGADPGCEYYNQGATTCSGTTPNMESPQWAVAFNRAYPVALNFAAGGGSVNQYGAPTTAAGTLPNPFTITAPPLVFLGSSATAEVVDIQNTSTNGPSAVNLNDSSGVGRGGFGFGNSGMSLAFLRNRVYIDAAPGSFLCLVTNLAGTSCGFEMAPTTQATTFRVSSVNEAMDVGNQNMTGPSAINFDDYTGTGTGGIGFGNVGMSNPLLAGNLYINGGNGNPSFCLITNLIRSSCDIYAANASGLVTIAYGVVTPSVAMPSGGVVTWNGDTSLSRPSAGVLSVDTTTPGNGAGTLKATQLLVGNTSTGPYFGVYNGLISGQNSSNVQTIALNSATGSVTQSYLIPGVVYSAAGTALPACNSVSRGWQTVVIDATSPAYMTAYTSGGTITAAVICSYNGTTYSWLTH